MLIALREVPVEERHLLFCSQLGRRRRRGRRGARKPNATTLPSSLTIPLAAGCDAAGPRSVPSLTT